MHTCEIRILPYAQNPTSEFLRREDGTVYLHALCPGEQSILFYPSQFFEAFQSPVTHGQQTLLCSSPCIRQHAWSGNHQCTNRGADLGRCRCKASGQTMSSDSSKESLTIQEGTTEVERSEQVSTFQTLSLTHILESFRFLKQDSSSSRAKTKCNRVGQLDVRALTFPVQRKSANGDLKLGIWNCCHCCKPAWPTTESVAPHGQFMKRDVAWGRMFRGGVREQRMC